MISSKRWFLCTMLLGLGLYLSMMAIGQANSASSQQPTSPKEKSPNTTVQEHNSAPTASSVKGTAESASITGKKSGDEEIPDEDSSQTEEPLPPGSTSVLATSSRAAAPELELCANQMPRNKNGVCPNIPPCPRRCIVDGFPADAAHPKSCGFQSDKAPSKYLTYSAQRINGKVCAWTFPPSEVTP